MMMISNRGRSWIFGGAMIGLAATMISLAAESPQKEAVPKEDRALQRTRKTVRMLDDIYKAAVVLITDKYVNDETDFAAGSAAIALFQAVREKGWHDVKLLDVSGQPYKDDNVASDAFEKEAVQRLKDGQAYFDRVERRGDERYLRAATPIPVVLDKCIMCHENYRQAKEGEPIGMLSYTLKIE